MKIENTEVYGFRRALYGMRNPRRSWEKSDSLFGPEGYQRAVYQNICVNAPERPYIGPNDLHLACKLIRAGSDERKFLRQIMIWADLTLPRYIWTELDTYKVATVRNSCATMNDFGKSSFTPDDFDQKDVLPETLKELNLADKHYRCKETHCHPIRPIIYTGHDIVRYMKRILPESYLLKSTYMMSYETAFSIYWSRRKHRLTIWREREEPDLKNPSITEWIRFHLPYMNDFIEACR